MARIAIGDVQGCCVELQQLVKETGFTADRDELWLVGDLVNRGPDSLGVLRWVKSLGDSARVVLGNHDLHLLAIALGSSRRLRSSDTLTDILSAPDRDSLLEWLVTRPLAITERSSTRSMVDLMVHAGVPPQWTATDLMAYAAEVSAALQRDPRKFFEVMYGNEPDRWHADLAGPSRWRYTINALTRMRYCDSDGRLDFRDKGAPGSQTAGLYPWFDTPNPRRWQTRVIFGHWSTLGLVQRDDLLALDTGCVWGGALTAVDLDTDECWQVPSRSTLRPLAD
jgi:bis(5'-nucleosyl)-tetraphosphatase (symmetrical)